MGFWDDNKDAHDQVYSNDPDNKGSFGHELLAGAASFGAMKMWEDHQRSQGKTVNHAFAKELIAGIAGGEADKLAETYGKNEWERHEAKQQAQQQSREMYDEHYGSRGGDSYERDPHPNIEQVENVNYNYNGSEYINERMQNY